MYTDLNLAVNDLEKLLEEAIFENIDIEKDEGKVGLYYSGGIDSSILDTYYDFEKLTYVDDEHTAEEFIEVFPKIMEIVGEPIYSFSPFAWYKLGEEAHKKGLKKVFSGESADELFGGYVRYMPQALYRQACHEFPSYTAMFPWEDDVNTVGKRDYRGPLKKLMDAEIKIAKHWGLKIVFPFNHKDVRQLAWSLPPEFKIQDFETKVILRRLLERRNPEYKHIEKHGLFCSVNEWIGAEHEGFDKYTYIELQKEILNGQKKA